MAEPSALASRTLARYDNPWPRDDVRYTPTFEEALKRYCRHYTPEDLVDFHAQFLWRRHIEFAAVGAFDPAAVKAALTQGPEGLA